MKGQINVEFLASALLYLLTIGLILTVGSNSLPDFAEDGEQSSLNTEAYELTTKILKEPGYSEASGGTTNWAQNSTTVNKTTAFGLTESSNDFNKINRSKLNNLKSFNRNSFENFTYSDFKNVTGVEHQYLMNFTWMPIIKTENKFDRGISNELKRDLAAYYSLDEDTGPVEDISGNGNDGLNNGATRGVNGVFSTRAFNFDQTKSDNVNTTYYPTKYTRTVSYWVKFDSVNSNQVIGTHDRSNRRFYLGMNTNSNPFAGMGDSFYEVTSETFKPDKWYHLALTGNGSTARIYLNGSEIGSFTYSYNGTKSTDPFYIGAKTFGNTPNYHVDGTIDEVRIYNKSMSSREIKNLMAGSKVIRKPDDIVYRNSENIVHYGTKEIDSRKYYVLQTSHRGVFDTAYISKSWNFTDSEPKRRGDKFNIYDKNFTVSKFQNNPRKPGNILVVSKHLKEFGPNVDSDSTVIRFDRYAVLDEEPVRMKVLAW